MENHCNYSDEWQPYIKDYDKFEYEIKLRDGTIVDNCYPNGGMFNSVSELHDGQAFHEKEVVEIRFSQNPKLALNENVSKVEQYENFDKEELERTKSENKGAIMDYMQSQIGMPSSKHKKLRFIQKPFVRTEPKIGRNQICPKCDSGKKYKICCI